MNQFTDLDIDKLYGERNYHEAFMSKANAQKIAQKIVVKMQAGVTDILNVSQFIFIIILKYDYSCRMRKTTK